jgi:hypothetical protein
MSAWRKRRSTLLNRTKVVVLSRAHFRIVSSGTVSRSFGDFFGASRSARLARDRLTGVKASQFSDDRFKLIGYLAQITHLRLEILDLCAFGRQPVNEFDALLMSPAFCFLQTAKARHPWKHGKTIRHRQRINRTKDTRGPLSADSAL